MRKILLSAVLALLVCGFISASSAEAAWPRRARGYVYNGNYYNRAYSYTVPQNRVSYAPYYYNGHYYNPAFSYTVPIR